MNIWEKYWSEKKNLRIVTNIHKGSIRVESVAKSKYREYLSRRIFRESSQSRLIHKSIPHEKIYRFLRECVANANCSVTTRAGVDCEHKTIKMFFVFRMEHELLSIFWSKEKNFMFFFAFSQMSCFVTRWLLKTNLCDFNVGNWSFGK